MNLPLRRLVAALAFLLLVTSACSSSDGEDTASTGTTATGDAASAENTDSADSNDSSPDGDATSIPVPEDDDAAEAAIAELDGDPTPEALTADRGNTARDYVRARFNIDPEPEWISCMVAETQRDDVLDTALQTPSVALGDVDDAQIASLSAAMNGCIDSISLAEWSVLAIGPQGDVRDSAPECLSDRYSDEETGDVVFSNFVALTYQFRLDPSGTDDLVDALATCTPITGLSSFFADQAEAANNFETTVDRTCLDEALAPSEVSSEFWNVFVYGEMPPVDFIEPYTADCSSVAFADLASEIPADFEPWSGTGALAAVVPSARADAYDAAPPMSIDPDGDYEAVISTGGGEIRIELFASGAPLTVNNFVNLARDGYYDQTVFHRVLDGFMAQGGDPTGSGFGGPGYSFADEFDSGEAFDRPGLLAMANSGANTNGSQFFITFGEPDHLTGAHTIFGEVVEGMDIVNAIERRDPNAATGRGQTIDSITIIEN